jgi:AAA domain
VTSGPIVYCALEGAQGHKNRIEAFRRGKISRAADSDPPFYLMATPLSLVRDQKAFTTDIGRQLGDLKPVAVCIDTLNRSLEGSESSDEDMTAYVRAADAIRDAFGCLVVIVHHCGHNGDRPRGHSSLMGALDVQIAVRRDAASNVVAELELSKDGDVGLQFVSRLRTVDVGVDQDGDSITSCVIEAIEGGAQPSAKGDGTKRPSKAAQTALRALSRAVDALGEIPPAFNYVPPGLRVVTVDQWRTYAYQLGISDTADPDARRMAFKRAHEALVAGKYIAAWNEYRWPTT